jgi:hypothetical protein
MRKNSGNALLVVVLLSVTMVLTAMGLVTFTSSQHKASYGLNNQVCLRYAAEAGLEEAKLRLFRDKKEAPIGAWFIPTFTAGLSASDQAAYTADPTSGPYTAVNPSFTRTLGSTTLGTREMRVEIYFDKTAGAYEYEGRVLGWVSGEGQNKYRSIAKMRFTYKLTPTPPDGMGYFSKYALFVDNWNPMVWFSHERFDGFVHSNGDVKWAYKDAYFQEKVTYGGSPYYWGSWTQAEKNAVHPAGIQKVSPIPMPTFNDINQDIRPVAQSGPPELNIDANATNPGSPWAGVSFASVDANFVWDPAGSGQGYVYFQARNSGGAIVKTVKYTIPKNGGDTVIYTDKPVQLKGIVQGRVTLATAASGTAVNNPSMNIIDDIYYVDDQGRPKMWVYKNADPSQPLPASGRTIFTDPQTGKVFKYTFNGIPTASNPAADNINTRTYQGQIVNWNDTAYKFMANNNYASSTGKEPVLGLIADGKFVMDNACPYNSVQCWAMYTQNNNYECERVTGVSKGNMAKFGSVVVKNVPIDMSSSGGGIDGWKGYGRQLPYRFDDHLLTTPPPSFVRIPNITQGGPNTVDLTIGASFYIGTGY